MQMIANLDWSQILLIAGGVAVIFWPNLKPIIDGITPKPTPGPTPGPGPDPSPTPGPVPDRERWIVLINAALALIHHFRVSNDPQGEKSAMEAYAHLVERQKEKPPTLDPPA
jgi:hypothetical protein